MARLVTIGDSVAQGFMSAGAAQTQQSYSTLLARMMEIPDYRFPRWPLGGIPVNAEALLRHLSKYYGDDIWGPFEWAGAVNRVYGFFDRLEDHYERGAGDFLTPYPGSVRSFHNLASFGFTVADSWQLTPAVAREQLLADDEKTFEDQSFALPSDAFYRSAFRVLNPSADPNLDAMSQLAWVRHFAEHEPDGVENLCVFLGANNALGTVLHLDIVEKFKGRLEAYKQADHRARMDINLSLPAQFEADFTRLIAEILNALNTADHRAKSPDWQVFIGTVPAVTIAPIAKGFGQAQRITDPFGVVEDGANYFERYSYVIFDEDVAMRRSTPHLTRAQAIKIDTRIAGFNRIIRAVVDTTNGSLDRPRFHIVDTARALLTAAIKRNDGEPTYDFPQGLRETFTQSEVRRRYDETRATIDLPDGDALLPSTKYYRAERGQVYQGGLFSLDGVHPSAIGQGLLAHEFAAVMKAAGVGFARDLDWSRVVRSDSLSWKPLNLIQEAFQHPELAALFLRRMSSRSAETVPAHPGMMTDEDTAGR